MCWLRGGPDGAMRRSAFSRAGLFACWGWDSPSPWPLPIAGVHGTVCGRAPGGRWRGGGRRGKDGRRIEAGVAGTRAGDGTAPPPGPSPSPVCMGRCAVAHLEGDGEGGSEGEGRQADRSGGGGYARRAVRRRAVEECGGTPRLARPLWCLARSPVRPLGRRARSPVRPLGRRARSPVRPLCCLARSRVRPLCCRARSPVRPLWCLARSRVRPLC